MNTTALAIRGLLIEAWHNKLAAVAGPLTQTLDQKGQVQETTKPLASKATPAMAQAKNMSYVPAPITAPSPLEAAPLPRVPAAKIRTALQAPTMSDAPLRSPLAPALPLNAPALQGPRLTTF